MHTFSYGDWSINYNSDLSGTAIVTKDGGWKIHIPCELLKEFVERRENDQIEGLRERAEKAESAANVMTNQLSDAVARANGLEAELANARAKLSLLEAGPDDYTPEQSLQFSLERKHEVALRSASDQVSALRSRLERVEEHTRRTTAERDELRDKLEGERASNARNADGLKERLRLAEDELEGKHGEARELRDKLDRTLRELEELRAKSTPSAEVAEWAEHLGEWDQCNGLDVKAAHFILSIAPAPKRKTRLDVYVEGWIADGGEADSYMLESVRREGIAQLKRQGLDPHAEMPEAP